MPTNTGSPFEANKGGRAHRGYEVDEGVRDGVTSPLLVALQDCWAQGGSPIKEEGAVGANMEVLASAGQQLGDNDAMLMSLLSPSLTMSRSHWHCYCHHFVGVVFATIAGRGVGINIIDGRCGGAWYCNSTCNCTSPTAATLTMTAAAAAGGQASGGAGASVPSLGGEHDDGSHDGNGGGEDVHARRWER